MNNREVLKARKRLWFIVAVFSLGSDKGQFHDDIYKKKKKKEEKDRGNFMLQGGELIQYSYQIYHSEKATKFSHDQYTISYCFLVPNPIKR